MKIEFPKIFFFDLEGTLLKKDFSLDNGKVAPSAWTVLAKLLGEDCHKEEEDTKDRWINGFYKGYLEWMSDTVRIHMKYGLTKDTFHQLVDQSQLHTGVEQVFSEIKKRGGKTCIISGGFKALADKFQPILKPDHVFCACEYFFDDAGHLESYNLLPTDEHGKAIFMELIASEHGVSPADCAFVGDGKNDVHLAKQVGFSIAFNAQDELIEASTVSINQNRNDINFLRVLDFFD